MTKVQEIEREVAQFSPEKLAAFRQGFIQVDAALWGRHFEPDVETGKLDAMAEGALRAHRSGNSSKL